MESSNIEQENGTVDSIATIPDLTNNNNNNMFDVESADDVIHDQLPTVEEYKASMPVGISPSKSIEGQSSSYHDNNNDDDDYNNNNDDDPAAHFNDSASYVQDQLPTVAEIKAMRSTDDGNWGALHYFAIFVGLIVLTVAIVVPTTLNQKNESSRSSNSQATTIEPTSRPTIPPMERKQDIIQYLTSIGISSETQLTTSGTPQSKAVDWLTTGDDFYMLVPETNEKYTRFVERYVLAVLYYSTNGQTWKYKMKFMTGIDHCDWNEDFLNQQGIIVRLGVGVCSTIPQSEETEGGLMTSQIALPMNQLFGSLPSELQYLHRLQALSLPFNMKLTGNLNFGLQNMQYLEVLELHYCGFSGTIPSEIGTLTKLGKLALGNNNLDGEIPTSLSDLTALEFLALDDNLLQGNIGSFGKLTNLKYAYLEDNQFTGEFTDTLLNGWSINMRELDFSRNLINSTIPTSIFTMTNLVVLDLNHNNLRGSIPAIPNLNGALMFFALHDNDLTGLIPFSISNLTALRHLDLARNKLISPIPQSLGLLSDLTYLFMGGNQFSERTMPTFLWTLTALQELSLKNNSITGTIPPAIGILTNLQLLDLDANRFTGTIPGELGLLTGLHHLLLNRNSLSGTLPSALTLLYDLDVFLIDNNHIYGTADVICQDPNIKLSYFVADCAGPNVNIECSCCNLCCNDLNTTCNNFGWNVNLDPIWEYGYMRSEYKFSQEILASGP